MSPMKIKNNKKLFFLKTYFSTKTLNKQSLFLLKSLNKRGFRS